MRLEESLAPFWPASIGRLEELVYLSSSLGRLQALPETIGGCAALEVLDVYGNRQLTTLPDSLSQLKALRKLNIGYNGLTRLSAGLAELHALEELGLHACEGLRLEAPGPLAALPKLKQIDLSSVPGFPTSRILPTSLEVCKWSFSFSPTIPAWFTELTSLQTLDLSYTEASEEEKATLQAALPNTSIAYD